MCVCVQSNFPDFERYGQWETERMCVCSKDHNRWFFVGSFRKVAKYSKILLFCLFCRQQGGHVRGRTGRRCGQPGRGWGRGEEGRGGGELEGCIMHRVHTHLCLRHGAHTSSFESNERLHSNPCILVAISWASLNQIKRSKGQQNRPEKLGNLSSDPKSRHPN